MLDVPCISADMEITVHFVGACNKQRFVFSKGLEFVDISEAIFECEQVQKYHTSDIKLFIKNEMGWEQELYDGVTFHLLSPCKITVKRINQDDVIIVRTKHDWFGGKESLNALLHAVDKSPVVKARIKYLNSSYGGYRMILNDGNSYYRATYISLFEHIIQTNNRQLFSKLSDKFHSLLETHEGDTEHRMRSKHMYDLTTTHLHRIISLLNDASSKYLQDIFKL